MGAGKLFYIVAETTGKINIGVVTPDPTKYHAIILSMAPTTGKFCLELRLPAQSNNSPAFATQNANYYSGTTRSFESNNHPDFYARQLCDGKTVVDFRSLLSAMSILNHGGPLNLDKDLCELLLFDSNPELKAALSQETQNCCRSIVATSFKFIKIKQTCTNNVDSSKPNPDLAYQQAQEYYQALISLEKQLNALAKSLEGSEPSSETTRKWKRNALAICDNYMPYTQALQELFSTELNHSADLITALQQKPLMSKASRQNRSNIASNPILELPQQLIVKGSNMLRLAIERLASNAYHAINELGLHHRAEIKIRAEADGTQIISVENPALINDPADKLRKLCQPCANATNRWERQTYGGLSLPLVLATARRLGAEMIAKYTSPEGVVTEHRYC